MYKTEARSTNILMYCSKESSSPIQNSQQMKLKESFLNKQKIFYTERVRKELEVQARRNIKRELSGL